jgi:N-acetylglucosaminyldiphosphoundecaprenol N-acetyl-beta-D-mannosaminyltransferase
LRGALAATGARHFDLVSALDVGRSTLDVFPVRSTQQILGIRFFDGAARDAVAQIKNHGGILIVPAAPALVRLQRDEIYRHAVINADTAIPDSGLMVLLWNVLRRQHLTRISGLAYLRQLICEPEFREPGRVFLVLPTETSRGKTLAWARREGLEIRSEDCYVAPMYEDSPEDRQLLARVEKQRPTHIVIAIGNGPQEKLGYFLRENLSYRPAIHCIGAALGFLTGDQVAIPDWADQFYLGWFLRLLAQPRVFVPRLTRASMLPWLIFRYGSEMPPLRKD